VQFLRLFCLRVFSIDKNWQPQMCAQLKVQKRSEYAKIPKRGTSKSTGYDLFSAYDYTVVAHGKSIGSHRHFDRYSRRSRWCFFILNKLGYYVRVAPRSSLSWKNHVDVGAGVIDEDYRGKICVISYNHGTTDFKSNFDGSTDLTASVSRGDKVAQLILTKITTPEIVEFDELNTTERGEGGFGSTGK
jgi:dUTP pyrophosphatase